MTLSVLAAHLHGSLCAVASSLKVPQNCYTRRCQSTHSYLSQCQNTCIATTDTHCVKFVSGLLVRSTPFPESCSTNAVILLDNLTVWHCQHLPAGIDHLISSWPKNSIYFFVA